MYQKRSVGGAAKRRPFARLGYDMPRFSVDDMDRRFSSVAETIHHSIQLRFQAKAVAVYLAMTIERQQWANKADCGFSLDSGYWSFADSRAVEATWLAV